MRPVGGGPANDQHAVRLLILDAGGVLYRSHIGQVIPAFVESVRWWRERIVAAAPGGYGNFAAKLLGSSQHRSRLGWIPNVGAHLYTPDPLVVASLRKWVQHLDVVILSNHRQEWLRAAGSGSVDDPLDMVADVWTPQRTGTLKPDRGVFGPILATSGVTGAETLYVDDRCQNLTAAKANGISTLWADPYRLWVGIIDDAVATTI